MDLSDAFAVVLQRHRKARGLSKESLAQKSGLHQTYIGLLERKLRNPSLDVADSIANALGISLSAMVAEAIAYREEMSGRKRG